MTIKGDIERDVRTKQRGLRLRAGDVVWRGVTMVQIKSINNSEVMYQEIDTGIESKIERRDFLSVSVVKVPMPDGTPTELLDRAWAVLSTKGLPRNFRVTAGRRFLRQARTQEERSKIQGWLYAVRMEREPKR